MIISRYYIQFAENYTYILAFKYLRYGYSGSPSMTFLTYNEFFDNYVMRYCIVRIKLDGTKRSSTTIYHSVNSNDRKVYCPINLESNTNTIPNYI